LTQNTEITIVIPVFNEGSNLSVLVDELRTLLFDLSACAEIIFVDDGSSDNTWNITFDLSSRESHPPNFIVKGLRLSRNFGKESAICAGLNHANGRAIVVMDGDLQHPPALLSEMIKTWRSNEADIVEAVRVDNCQAGPLRRLLNAIFYGFYKIATRADLNGVTDFKLMDRRVLVAWRQMLERGVYFRGMTAWLGFSRKRIPFVVPKRMHGNSGWSNIALFAHACDAIVSFSVLPLRLVTILGVLFLAFSIIIMFHTLAIKILGLAFTGFSTVIILNLLTSGCIIFCLGLIGEYIGKIYAEVKFRPRYLIYETIGLECCQKTTESSPDEHSEKFENTAIIK